MRKRIAQCVAKKNPNEDAHLPYRARCLLPHKKKVKPKKSENSSTREKLNFEKSLENLESIDWKAWQQTVSELDSHETYHSFQLKIREALVFKEVKAKGSRANKDWMTHELLKKRDKVYQARRLAFKKGTPHYEQKYTNLKKEYHGLF